MPTPTRRSTTARSAAVIGHELTHGFDDQGRKIDATGALRDWWTADRRRPSSSARAKMLGAQYAQFEPVPGVHINPDLTMGENIADLGGLTMALDAYHASLNGKPAPVLDGLTGDQRVFLGWAQAWAGKANARCHPPGDDQRSAQLAQVPGQRRRPEHRRLVRGLRREARRQALSPAGGTRADLVGGRDGRAAIRDFHAHIYYDPAEVEARDSSPPQRSSAFRSAGRPFSPAARSARTRAAACQLTVPRDQFGDVAQWLALNRGAADRSSPMRKPARISPIIRGMSSGSARASRSTCRFSVRRSGCAR